MTLSTCDLYDQLGEDARVPDPVFRDFGGRKHFSGTAVTIKCFEDNSRIRELVATPGKGKVLVVDGGGSMRCAVLGDLVAGEAVNNGWEGLVIYACVRDIAELEKLDLGIKALGAIPRKSTRRGEGSTNLTVTIAGAPISPGDQIIADRDGLLILTAEQVSTIKSG